jgi:EmrB/QacA subfamily drug resistance transporter
MQKAENITSTPGIGLNTNATPVLTIRGRPVNSWLVLISVVFGFFMALLDATIVNIAIPSIQTSLKADLTSVSWVLNAYNLVFAVLLVTAGRFADQYGRKRLFMIGMIIFSLGSLFCALAETIGGVFGSPAINWLIGFRAFQAIGAAILNPISLAIITAVFPREKRGAAIGVWGALSGLAAAAGPVLGGFLVQNFDWRWIFFVNLPFCVIGLLLVWLFVPETRDLKVSKRVDVLGLGTLSIAIFAQVLAIIQGNDWGWTSAPILGLFACTVVAMALFVVVELRQAEPIVDFSLFRVRSFSVSNITIFLFGVAIQGAFLILVLYFINALGYSQLNAAYAVIPIPLASFVISAVGGRFSGSLNPRIMAIVGLLSMTIGLGSLYTLSIDAAFFDTAWRGVLIGIGMGFIFTSLPNIVLSEVPRSKLGVGSGVFNTFRQVGFTLGVAILISVFTGQLQPNLNQARANSIAMVQADTKILPQLRQGIVTGLKSASTSGSSRATNFDLPALADKLPPQVPAQVREANRAELKVLGAKISNEFKTGVVDAFKAAWLVSAIVGLAGLVSALFAITRRRSAAAKDPNTENTAEETVVPMGH